MLPVYFQCNSSSYLQFRLRVSTKKNLGIQARKRNLMKILTFSMKQRSLDHEMRNLPHLTQSRAVEQPLQAMQAVLFSKCRPPLAFCYLCIQRTFHCNGLVRFSDFHPNSILPDTISLEAELNFRANSGRSEISSGSSQLNVPQFVSNLF